MIKIKIYSTGQIYSTKTDLKLLAGQEVVIETEGIIEPAVVLCGKNCPKPNSLTSGEEVKEVKFLRLFSEEDKILKGKLKKNALKYLNETKNKVFRHGLDMKIINADLSFDQKKLTFYFTAEGRIDFRSLVADMAGDYKKNIRLQQVGPRDEAKLYGGFGKCGRELCCAKFLNNLESITLKMAKIQDLPKAKSNTYAGCCGKLMCCLSYEAIDIKDLKSKNTSKNKENEVAP